MPESVSSLGLDDPEQHTPPPVGPPAPTSPFRDNRPSEHR